MKKALAISLLVICNTAAILVLSWINFCVWWSINFTAAVLIGLAAVTALAFASSRLLPLFERKFRLEAKWFILAAYGSPVIGAIVCLIVDDIALLLFTNALAYLISGAAWVSTVIDTESPE